MKKDVTIYHKISRILVGVVFLVLLAAGGCSNVLMKSPAAPEAAGPGGGVKVTLRLFTGSARTVMPGMDLLTWHITAEQGTDNIEATGTYPTYTLELPTVGRWIFTVKGINPTGDEIFTGSITQEIGGGSTVSISIPLSPGSAMTAGTGQINLTLKVPDTVGTVMYKLDSDTEFTDLTPSNGSCSLNKAGVSAGPHTLSLYFLDERGTTLYMCTEAVNVWNGMTSSQWINTGNIGYITGNGEFELTDVIIDAFLNTMGSVVYVNDSVAVNAPATGSIFAPVNSVSTAVDILRKANPDGNYIGTIMVSGATTIDQEIEVQSGETLTVKGTEAGASIKNTSGRVFNITSGGSVTLGDGITLTGTVTGENARGGAVYVTGGNFTMESGSTIADSSVQGTSASGGGVYVMNGTFIMEDGSKITGSSATVSGGGVAVSTGGTFTMRGGTIDGTGASSNAESGGGVEIYDAIFTMEGGTITGNNATYGGGVRVDSGKFIMKDGTISDNNATSLGGGVCVINGSFTMSDTATIQGNTATTHGGGVYVGGDSLGSSTFTMSGGTIGGTDAGSANSAQYGGGVYVANGIFTMDGGTISENSASGTGASGGGVCISGGTFTMSGGAVISKNSAGSSGGGVFVSQTGIFTMEGGTIGGTGGGSPNSAENGGGVYIFEGTFTMSGSAVISGNNASSSSSSSSSSGGGVYIHNGTFTMSGGAVISGNSASSSSSSSGGGVYVSTDGIFTMEGGTIGGIDGASANSAKSGGGVCVYKGVFTMSDGSISRNTATDSGGGVFVQDGTFTMKSTAIIQENEATGGSSHACGGGVYVNGGEFTMTGTAIIQDNEATGSNGYACGGGVYVNVGEFTMNGDAIIQGNEAAGRIDYAGGGGVYVNGGGEFTMNDSAIIQKNNASTDETSKAAAGGGVYLTGGGTFSMVGNAKIQENKVTGSNGYAGGGVVVYGNCTFTMSGGIISGNSANNGGGVYVDSNGEFTMEGGTIGGTEANSANEADLGGGVYVNGTFTVNGNGTPVITGNSSNTATNGNNVYLPSGKTITIGVDGLAGGEIGVTAEEMKPGTAVQITDKNVNNAASIFTSDEKGYRIEENVNVSSGGTAVFLSDTETSYSTGGNGGVSLGDFNDAFKAIESTGGDITVFKPVEITEPTTIFPSSGVTIDITASGATTVFDVQDGGSLTLGGGDGMVNVSGDPTASSPASAGDEKTLINISSGGTVTIADNANIQNNKAGRGVTVTDGTLIMTGGSIKDNTGGYNYGSGVYVSGQNAIFKMSGGEISDNTLELNTSPLRQGAGVMVCNGAKFTLSDSGKITDNSGYEGVGVCVRAQSTFNMEGGEISGNYGTGTSGGVYVHGGVMNMTGGVICNNKCEMSGAGGVFIESTFDGTGAVDASIKDNYCSWNDTTGTGKDVYVKSGGVFEQGTVDVGVGP